MDEYTDTYATIVIEKYNAARAKTRDAQLLVETRLNFTQWVPDGFGTGDACIIADGCLEIIDFKYGKGVKVSAYENPQMKIYALGAYDKFSFEYNIDRVAEYNYMAATINAEFVIVVRCAFFGGDLITAFDIVLLLKLCLFRVSELNKQIRSFEPQTLNFGCQLPHLFFNFF